MAADGSPGFCASQDGLLFCMLSGYGQGVELDANAAVVIGGTCRQVARADQSHGLDLAG